MADKNKKTPTDAAYESDTSDALQSFLERDTSDKSEKPKKPKKKLSKNALWVIIGIVVIAAIVATLIILNLNPATVDTSETDLGTDTNLTVNESGEHQAALVLNEDGELDNNSYGELLTQYTPSDIKQIDVSNESGNYTVICETPKSEADENGETETGATLYTLVGFEDVNLKSGGPDAIANDAASIKFTSVADITGDNASDYGFSSPRATVKTAYTDGTTSTVIVGADAPTGLGTYVMFGSSKTVYLVSADSVDSFLFSVLDLLDLKINETPTDTANTEVQSVTMSGSGIGSTIEFRQNSDKAIDSSYVMIKPKKMFVSELEASRITGAIRGLYADKAVCVNPDSSQLSKYGLSSPYAKITAIYPDETITLSASKPTDDSAYIIASGSNIIYQISAASIPWINTNIDKLTPDMILDPNFSSVSAITVSDSSGTYKFDVATVTESVTNDSGEEEQVEVTTANYGDKQLDNTNYEIFFQNIANMQNAGKATEGVSSSPVLTITLSYSTGRSNDTIKIYPTNNTKYTATLNGDVVGMVYKSYCTKFSSCIQDLINGKTVQSF